MARRYSRTSQASISQEQTNAMIQKKAQEIYEKSGRKPGRDMDNWVETERIVKKRQ